MRVLFSLLDATDAGGQRVAAAVARRLSLDGATLGVVVPSPGLGTAPFEEMNASLFAVDIGTLRNATQASAVLRVLRGFDVLYSHTSVPGETSGR